MEKDQLIIKDNIGALKEKAEILRSTLLAIYVAGKEEHYDAKMYIDAIHGTADLAQELADLLKEIMWDMSA